MNRKRFLVIAPACLLLGIGGKLLMDLPGQRRAAGRIVDSNFLRLERKLGYHLYAPTWLPYGGRVGRVGALVGKFRILQEFSDNKDRPLVFLAQERRTPERDRYHRRMFEERADVRSEIDGKPGFFVMGPNGERRLFWNQEDMALVLSSSFLTDAEMLIVARKIR